MYLSLTSGVNGAYTTWTPIDAQAIVCKSLGAPGQATVSINVTSQDTVWIDRWKPHIITFYRTTTGSSQIQYGALDSSAPQPKPVIGTMTTNLIKVPGQPTYGGRRLASKATDAVTKPEVQAEPTLDDLLEEEDGDMPEDHEDLLEVEEEFNIETDDQAMAEFEEQRATGRVLKSGRSRSSSSRSRSPPARPSPPPKPTYSPSDPRSYSTARRRANPATARRRGNPVPPGVRRRVTSPVQHNGQASKFSNPSNAAAGNYAYGSQTKIDNNFPSGYSSSSYGYTGGMAHKSTSSSKIMMAAAGGAVAGMGAYYLYSRWSRGGWGWRNSRCEATTMWGNTWSGSCTECYYRYSSCRRLFQRNAARDDIMGTGFIPGDFTSPIKITFYSLTGSEFEESVICPPAGYNFTTNTDANGNAWNPPDADIFVTLTSMMELAETLDGQNYDQASLVAASRSFACLAVGLLLGLAAVV